MIEELEPLYLEWITTPFTPWKQPAHVKKHRVAHPEAWKRIAAEYPGKTLNLTGQVWVWSDLHLGHKNIIGFSDRPYSDTHHMREQMIMEHNVRVNPEDTVITVGDFAFLNDNGANELLQRLNGHQILIIGNHDIQKKKVKKLAFDEIYFCAHMKVDEIDFMFTHYPMKNIPEWCFNVHGHEHVNHLYTNTDHHLNVNCECHEYHPLMLEEVVHEAKVKWNRV